MLLGHLKEVHGLAFSPDGKRLASSSWDHTIKLWDVAGGNELQTLRGHPAFVDCVSFSGDGKRLASASWRRDVRVWDAESGNELLNVANGGNRVAFNPDGRQLAAVSVDHIVKILDAANGHSSRRFLGHNEKVNALAFDPDGNRLATASWDKTVKIWDTQVDQKARSCWGIARVSRRSLSVPMANIWRRRTRPDRQVVGRSDGKAGPDLARTFAARAGCRLEWGRETFGDVRRRPYGSSLGGGHCQTDLRIGGTLTHRCPRCL